MSAAFTAGDLILLTRAASPQFVRPLTVRVIREIADRHPYEGWTWVEGYELSAKGEAVRRRELYVLRAGVRRMITARPATPAEWITSGPLRQDVGAVSR